MQYQPIEKDPQPADRLVLWLPVFMCAGIGTYFLLPFEPSLSWVAGIFAAALLAVVTVFLTVEKWRDAIVWHWFSAFILMFIGSFLLIQMHTRHQEQTHHLLEYSVWNKPIHGMISSFERVGTGWRVVLADASVDGGKTPYTLRLTIRKKGFIPEEGGMLTVKGSVMAPSSPLVPNSFDFRRHAFYRGISGYGYATQILSYDAPAQDYGKNRLEEYRDWLTERVYAVLQQPEAGIVTALLNGQRAGIAKKSTAVLQQSGLQHVISISGLHVSLLAITIFFSTRLLMACSMRLAASWPIKKIAAFFALIGIVFYLLIVGNSPPTLRAVLVTGAALCAVMLDREAIQMRVVALAAMAILLIQPDSLVDIGFQMSFAAVIGLVAFYQYTRGFWTHEFWKRNIVFKILLLGVGTIATSIVATIVTAPLVLMYFQQVPLLSMLANIMAAPAITFLVMPGTFLAYLFTPFPVIGDVAIHIMGLGVENMMDVAHFVAGLPSSVWRIPSLPLVTVILTMLSMWILVTFAGKGRYIAAFCLMIACVVGVLHRMPDLYLTSDRTVLYPDPESNGLYVDGRLQKFNRDMMLQWTSKEKAHGFPCASDICELDIKGKKIRFIRTVAALEQACDAPADLLVTRYYLDRKCSGTTVLDRHMVRRNGGYAVFIRRDIITLTPVFPDYHKPRPWNHKNVGKRNYTGKFIGKSL